jgi:hypothetical protein
MHTRRMFAPGLRWLPVPHPHRDWAKPRAGPASLSSTDSSRCSHAARSGSSLLVPAAAFPEDPDAAAASSLPQAPYQMRRT